MTVDHNGECTVCDEVPYEGFCACYDHDWLYIPLGDPPECRKCFIQWKDRDEHPQCEIKSETRKEDE